MMTFDVAVRTDERDAIPPDVEAPVRCVVGPPVMVAAIKEVLTSAGVNEDAYAWKTSLAIEWTH